MKKLLLSLSLSLTVLFGLTNFSASALSVNSFGGKIYETPLEVCQKLDSACLEEDSASGSFVSGNEINLKSDSKLTVEADAAGSYFSAGDLVINFYTPFELDGYFEFDGNITLNDFNETSSPTISNVDGKRADLWGNGVLTLNNLKTKNTTGFSLFTFYDGSTLIANNVTHTDGTFLTARSNQNIYINGGSYTSDSLIFFSISYAKKVRIVDGTFKTTNGAVMDLSLYKNNIEIISGTFESTSDEENPEIFRVYASTTEEETRNVIERLVASGSEFYDEEKGTSELTYSNIVEPPHKGETRFGLVSSRKLVVRETGGQGGAELEEDEEASQPEPVLEEEETEENPDTTTGFVSYYYPILLISTTLFILCLRKNPLNNL